MLESFACDNLPKESHDVNVKDLRQALHAIGMDWDLQTPSFTCTWLLLASVISAVQLSDSDLSALSQFLRQLAPQLEAAKEQQRRGW